MAFPSNPIDGQLYGQYKFVAAQSMWKRRIAEVNEGDTDMGRLYTFSESNQNTNTFWSVQNPVSGSFHVSASCASRVPAGAKGVLLRWWVQANATDSYWAGFGQGDDAGLAGDASTIAVGAYIEAGDFHHATISVPLDDAYKFKVGFFGAGFKNFNCNIVGYYM